MLSHQRKYGIRDREVGRVPRKPLLHKCRSAKSGDGEHGNCGDDQAPVRRILLCRTKYSSIAIALKASSDSR